MEKLIARLQRGRRLQVDQSDVEDKDAIMTAAQLAAAREPHATMRPEFKQHLAEMLQPRRAQGFTRRVALTGGLAAAAGLVGGFGLERLMETESSSPATASSSFIEPQPGRWVDVAAVVEPRPGTHAELGHQERAVRFSVSGHENRPSRNLGLARVLADHRAQGILVVENAVGHAGLDDGLRAREIRWRPLRLARVRCERVSVCVVRPLVLHPTLSTTGYRRLSGE